MNEWISVKNDLPKEYKLVIVRVTRYGYYPDYTDVAHRQDDKWSGHTGTWKAITHWQPLPEPPA